MANPTHPEIAAILNRYEALYSSFQAMTDNRQALLLAHYTSVQIVELILKTKEIWFSNPLYMNDLEELRLGILLGSELFPRYVQVAEQDDSRRQILLHTYNTYVAHLEQEAALDTYVFCLSEHDIANDDGLLSMWREYGSKGNGAALVFNTQKVNFRPDSPLLICKVAYATPVERRQHLDSLLSRWAQITKDAALPKDHLSVAGFAAFNLIKSFALTTKHKGFSEEREWRVIYVPERDPLGLFKSRLDYFVGPRGVEPKLKFKFGHTLDPTAGPLTAEPFTTGNLTDMLEFIMLGPTVSSPIARQAFIRMLQRNDMQEFADRIRTSTIPLRPSL